MSFWIAVVLLSAISLFLLAFPLLRKSQEEADRADYDLSVFKDQLKELDKDLERGLISEAEAETARIEIQRRLLAADDKRKGHEFGSGTSNLGVAISAFVGVAIIAGALGLYYKIGMPGYQDVPFASRDIQKERHQAQSKGMDKEIATLVERLKEKPEDVEGWMLLGRTLSLVERKDEAVQAYKNAVKYSDRHPSVLADYAESKIYASQGNVDEEVIGMLQEAIQKDPSQLKARFYLGFAQVKKQDFKEAIQSWTDLLAIAPGDAAWLEQVHQQIQMAADAGNLNPADFKPSAQASVMGKQMKLEWETEASQSQNGEEGEAARRAELEAAAQNMTPEEQAEMIRGMVDRLADRLKENPDDIEGWKRLAQAYMVLGEKDKAIEARNMIKELGGN